MSVVQWALGSISSTIIIIIITTAVIITLLCLNSQTFWKLLKVGVSRMVEA
jgi:hypothetical protein